MNTTLLRSTIVGALAAAATTSMHAQSADALIDKLVEKGILTVKEANELRDEADKNFTTAYAVKSGLPDWVTTLRFNGDLRGRFDGGYSDHPAFVDRNTFRYRLRAGFTAVLKDQFEVGFRLSSAENATGTSGGNPISGNTTFSDNAAKKSVFIDLAYGKWTPVNHPDGSAAFTVGKMENPFVLSEMLFDADYTPEGFGQQFTYHLSSAHALRLNLGEFLLEEVGSSSRDAYLLGAQLRAESVWSPQWQTSAGVSFLAIAGEEALRTANVPNQNRGNTRDKDGNLLESYYPIVADAAVTYTLAHAPYYSAPFPMRVMGEYIHNPGASVGQQGYGVSVMFGKSGKKGLWDLSYKWKELQADVWYEELTDSDFGAFYEVAPVGGSAGYGAGTNLRGHVIRATYSPYDSLTLALTYYLADLINESPAGSDSGMSRLQVDATWKF